MVVRRVHVSRLASRQSKWAYQPIACGARARTPRCVSWCAAYPLSEPPTSRLPGRAPRGLAGPEREGANGTPSRSLYAWRPCLSMRISARLMIGSGPDELVPPNRTLPVLADGSQDFLAGGSGDDGGAGGGQGGPKGEPRRPPPEPNHLLGQLAHAGWASSLTATLCLPQIGQSKRETLVFKRIRCAQAPARVRACKGPHIRGPVRAPRSLVSPQNVAHDGWARPVCLCMIKF